MWWLISTVLLLFLSVWLFVDLRREELKVKHIQEERDEFKTQLYERMKETDRNFSAFLDARLEVKKLKKNIYRLVDVLDVVWSSRDTDAADVCVKTLRQLKDYSDLENLIDECYKRLVEDLGLEVTK